MTNKTLLSALLCELEVFKVGENRDFYRFSRFLTNFEFLYYGQHFEIQYETKPITQVNPLAINTELQGSKGSQGASI